MTKEEIRERFRRVVERAMSRPLTDFPELPANPSATARLQPLRVAED